MDYSIHYQNLISSRKTRQREEDRYYERHHILPVSMGGSDNEDNLVWLTGREHFIAHWLLWRIHRNRQTAFAFFCMQNWKNKKKQGNNRCTSARAYEEAREAYSSHLSIQMKGRKVSFKKRRPLSDKTRKILSEKKKGVKLGQISDHRSEKLKKFQQSRRYNNPEYVDSIHKVCENCKNSFSVSTWRRFSRFCCKSCASKSHNRKRKLVEVFNKLSQETKIFSSISDAAKNLGTTRSAIYKNQDNMYVFKIIEK